MRAGRGLQQANMMAAGSSLWQVIVARLLELLGNWLMESRHQTSCLSVITVTILTV